MNDKQAPTTEPDDFDSDRFCTPPEFAALLDCFWPEGIGLDVCWDEDSILRPMHALCLREQGTSPRLPHTTVEWGRDGLGGSWGNDLLVHGHGRNGLFANIPYSGPAPWALKAAVESRLHPDIEIVLLMRSAMGTKYWSEHIWPNYSAVGLISTPRLKFLQRGKIEKATGKYEHVSVLMAGRNALANGAVDRFKATIGRRCVKVIT